MTTQCVVRIVGMTRDLTDDELDRIIDLNNIMTIETWGQGVDGTKQVFTCVPMAQCAAQYEPSDYDLMERYMASSITHICGGTRVKTKVQQMFEVVDNFESSEKSDFIRELLDDLVAIGYMNDERIVAWLKRHGVDPNV